MYHVHTPGTNMEMLIRCDGVFARRHILSWCEHNGTEYLVGLSKNNRIINLAKPTLETAQHSAAVGS